MGTQRAKPNDNILQSVKEARLALYLEVDKLKEMLISHDEMNYSKPTYQMVFLSENSLKEKAVLNWHYEPKPRLSQNLWL